jgi:hypothetical protein
MFVHMPSLYKAARARWLPQATDTSPTVGRDSSCLLHQLTTTYCVCEVAKVLVRAKSSPAPRDSVPLRHLGVRRHRSHQRRGVAVHVAFESKGLENIFFIFSGSRVETRRFQATSPTGFQLVQAPTVSMGSVLRSSRASTPGQYAMVWSVKPSNNTYKERSAMLISNPHTNGPAFAAAALPSPSPPCVPPLSNPAGDATSASSCASR